MVCQNCGKYTGPFLFCGKNCYDIKMSHGARHAPIPQLPLHAPNHCKNVDCFKVKLDDHPYCGRGCAPGGRRHKGNKY